MHYTKENIEEEFIDAEGPEISGSQSKEAMNGLAKFGKAIYEMCSLKNIDSCMIVDDKESELDKAPEAPVNFVVSNLQFNLKRVCYDKNSNHEVFSSADMKLMSKFYTKNLQEEYIRKSSAERCRRD